MLKENYFILFFFGIMIIYITNNPPTIIVKHPKIDSMSNVNYLIEQNGLSHVELCNK